MKIRNDLLLVEATAPSTPPSGFISLYANNNDLLIKDDSGVETSLTTNSSNIVSVREVNATGSALTTDYHIICDASGGNFSLNLFPASSGTYLLAIAKKFRNRRRVLVTPNNTDTILMRNEPYILRGQNSIILISDGINNWTIN